LKKYEENIEMALFGLCWRVAIGRMRRVECDCGCDLESLVDISLPKMDSPALVVGDNAMEVSGASE